MSKNVWYLPGPFHRYNEDVKSLAKEAGLRIIDANVTTDRKGEADKTPTVTVKESQEVLVIGGGNSADIEVLRRDLESVGLLVDSLGDGELVKPEEGDTAIRLFDVLTGIHAGVQGLKNHAADLQGQLDKAQADLSAEKARNANTEPPEELTIPQLKEQLDAKSIAYKVNDSKPELLALLKGAQ